jgi:surfeit locus 1 family protein
VFGGHPKSLMLIADQAASGLEPTARPELSSVPNNHLAYAVQWFLFAGVAAIIYVLALRLRAAQEPSPRQKQIACEIGFLAPYPLSLRPHR